MEAIHPRRPVPPQYGAKQGVRCSPRKGHASERAAVAVAKTAGQGEAVALERAVEAETRAQAAQTAYEQANDAARKASQWATAEARRTSRIRPFFG